MRVKNVTWVVAGLLLLGMFSAPASANKVKDKDGVPGGLKDTGFLSGNATVGKLRDRCLHTGESNVRGAGIGLPHQTKDAYWEIGNTAPAVVISLTGLTKVGELKACGRMTAVLSAVGGGLGAACGASKGWDGKGTLSYPDTAKETIWLKELGWKASVTTFVITGVANQAPSESLSKNKPHQDLFVAEIEVQGLGPCVTKEPDKSDESDQGFRNTTVSGRYTITNGLPVDLN